MVLIGAPGEGQKAARGLGSHGERHTLGRGDRVRLLHELGDALACRDVSTPSHQAEELCSARGLPCHDFLCGDRQEVRMGPRLEDWPFLEATVEHFRAARGLWPEKEDLCVSRSLCYGTFQPPGGATSSSRPLVNHVYRATLRGPNCFLFFFFFFQPFSFLKRRFILMGVSWPLGLLSWKS